MMLKNLPLNVVICVFYKLIALSSSFIFPFFEFNCVAFKSQIYEQIVLFKDFYFSLGYFFHARIFEIDLRVLNISNTTKIYYVRLLLFVR